MKINMLTLRCVIRSHSSIRLYRGFFYTQERTLPIRQAEKYAQLKNSWQVYATLLDRTISKRKSTTYNVKKILGIQLNWSLSV